jgi:hypothetical protein
MRKTAKLIRLFLITLGLFTVLVSFTIIFNTVKVLSSEPGNGLLSVALVVLLLGMMLTVGGICLAVRCGKNRNHFP